MQYYGGKALLAKKLASELCIRATDQTAYLEPFLGVASVMSEVYRLRPDLKLFGCDTHEDLVLMWKALQKGWIPPDEICYLEWLDLKVSEPSGLRGFAGHACSFGGKWFRGYAHPNATRRDYAQRGKRSLLKKLPALKQCRVELRDYSNCKPSRSTIVYCDPPYQDTESLRTGATFSSKEFWYTINKWCDKGVLVFVSEHNAPEGWVEI